MKNLAKLPSAEYLWSRIDYNPESGTFLWRPRTVFGVHEKKWNTRFSGKPAGGVQIRKYDGYPTHFIRLDGVLFRAHRIAWKMMTGDEPPSIIDHVNGDSIDNSWKNIRRGDDGRNGLNRSRDRRSVSGISGVTWSKSRGMWVVKVRHKGKLMYFGEFSFDDLDIAAMEAMEARAGLGFSQRHGVQMSSYLAGRT